MKRSFFLIPLILFLTLCVFLWRGLGKNPTELPSALIGKPFPAFVLPSLTEKERVLTQADLLGKVSLVNVWATWCASCRVEHPLLLTLARDEKIFIVGVNYKDNHEKAKAWLNDMGNPYYFSIEDSQGKLGVDLGVYGAPETYLVDSNGIIRYKYVGVLTEAIWNNTLKPEFEKWQKK